jgi:hypothetical protein
MDRSVIALALQIVPKPLYSDFLPIKHNGQEKQTRFGRFQSWL